MFLFLKTLPVAVDAGADFATGVFLVVPVPPVTPLLMVPMTVLFAAAAGAAALVAVPPRAVLFLITVDVLPSLDSLMPLTFRAVRVVVAFVGAVPAAPLLVLRVPLADVLADVLAVEVDVFIFRDVWATRVERAFSARLLRMFDALLFF